MDDREAELERIREALRACVERSTLRAVAMQVGMSPTGLHKFLSGSNPYGPTREKARAWFYRQAGMNSIPPDDTVLFLRRLFGATSDPDTGVRRILDMVEAFYREEGMSLPDWIERVRHRVARPPPAKPEQGAP